jgi:hypothetical protein
VEDILNLGSRSPGDEKDLEADYWAEMDRHVFPSITPGGKIMARGTSDAVSVHLNHPTVNVK